jgi:Tfp pilus assembly protein PilN
MISLKSSLGIEIRENDLVLTALNKGIKQWAVANFKTVSNYKQVNKIELKKEINRFIKSHKVAREHIVLGVPRDQVILRLVELPREVEENLKQVMKFQVESLTPSEEEQPCYDYTILNRGPEDPRLTILLAMIKKSALDEYLALLNEVGVRPNSVQVSAVALSNVVLSGHNNLTPETYLMFNFTQGQLELLAIRNKQLLYSKYRKLNGAPPNADLLLDEIDKALSNLRIEDGQIEKIWFCGEETETILPEFRERVPDCAPLSERLAGKLGKKMQPFRANELATSIGLALGGLSKRPPVNINLLPEDQRVRISQLVYLPSLLLLLAAIGLGIAMYTRSYFQEKELLRQLTAEVDKLNKEAASVKKVKKDIDALQQRVNFIESIVTKPDVSLEIWKDLTIRLPDDAYLRSFRYQKGEVNLNGFTGVRANTLMPLLEKSPFLKDVEQSGQTYKDTATGKEVFTFKAKLRSEK